jgi:hypothetical protein
LYIIASFEPVRDVWVDEGLLQFHCGQLLQLGPDPRDEVLLLLWQGIDVCLEAAHPGLLRIVERLPPRPSGGLLGTRHHSGHAVAWGGLYDIGPARTNHDRFSRLLPEQA